MVNAFFNPLTDKQWLSVQRGGTFERARAQGNLVFSTIVTAEEFIELKNSGFNESHAVQYTDIEGSTRRLLKITTAPDAAPDATHIITPTPFYTELTQQLRETVNTENDMHTKIANMQSESQLRSFENLLLYAHNTLHIRREIDDTINIPLPKSMVKTAERYFESNAIHTRNHSPKNGEAYTQSHLITSENKIREVFGDIASVMQLPHLETTDTGYIQQKKGLNTDIVK